MAWMWQLVNAASDAALPATGIEDWPACPGLEVPLPLTLRRHGIIH
jgi:hypothetical protein